MAFDLKKKILIVDDTPTIRRVVSQMLHSKGCTNVVEAEDGQQAWMILENCFQEGEPIEFVMSDWKMPNLCGLSLIKKMKNDSRFSMIPFLMVSAEGNKESVLEAHQAGITDFVVKPFSTDVLDEKINEIFAA